MLSIGKFLMVDGLIDGYVIVFGFSRFRPFDRLPPSDKKKKNKRQMKLKHLSELFDNCL